MNSGAFKSNAGRCAFIGKFSIAVFMLGLVPQQANATTADAQYKQYIVGICNTFPAPQGWNVSSVATMCMNVSGAIALPTDVGVSANLGTANAGSEVTLRKKKRIRELSDEQKDQPAKGASSDGGGWGFLISPQYGNSNRTETDLENGYQANLKGLAAGLDYRFSDSFVLGAILGQTKDTATFLNNAGSLKTSSNTFNFYGTYLPSENASIDAYLGYGKLSLDSNRHVAFGSISGTTSGSASGRQIMAGMSVSYQKDAGRFNLAPFINLDYIKTSFKAYDETGTTGLEMHYGDRSTNSFTSSLGARVSTSYGYDWGALQPSARLAAVHEFQNRNREISNELVSTPGSPFLVTTDSPDRNYLNLGLGVSAALNGGTQLFLDYDKRAQDRLLSSWAISLGALMEF